MILVKFLPPWHFQYFGKSGSDATEKTA